MEKTPKHFGSWLSGREVQLKLTWQEGFLEEVSIIRELRVRKHSDYNDDN